MYPVVLEPDDNGTLLVTCPDLPEVTTWGEDADDALRHAADAIEEALAARIAHRDEIPEPSPSHGRPVPNLRRDKQPAHKVYAEMDQDAPRNLGWRLFVWKNRTLCSPLRYTPWPEDGILRAENWSGDDEALLRGHAGIHARRMPRDWRRAEWRADNELFYAGYAAAAAPNFYGIPTVGIAECWGRVLDGTEGWRAEYARILAVRAPTAEIGLAIERVYPSIRVYFDE